MESWDYPGPCPHSPAQRRSCSLTLTLSGWPPRGFCSFLGEGVVATQPVIPANFWGLREAPSKVRNPCHANPIPHVLRQTVPSLAQLASLPSPTAPSLLDAFVGGTAPRARLPCLEWPPNLEGNSVSGSPDSQANYQTGWKGERRKALQTSTDFWTIFFHIYSSCWSRGGQREGRQEGFTWNSASQVSAGSVGRSAAGGRGGERDGPAGPLCRELQGSPPAATSPSPVSDEIPDTNP